MLPTSRLALLILARGAEEMEAVISADVMRRGGIDVTIAGLNESGPILCSRNVQVQPDMELTEAQEKGTYDAVVLPGGAGGAKELSSSAQVGKILESHWKAGKVIAAICAAPTALLAHKICLGMKVTSHPSVKSEMEANYSYLEDRVVIDDRLVTSRGPGTAFEFALAIIEMLCGKESANKIIPPMMLKD
ncbi:Parkinson disease protein 7 homolog isoform X2 [Oscarella lobularis]|uniref:Parkinson disease protein 7 homolog isoform X2 n=1 Tax=Oscarella lobularis TaxID=121494 RepID=UPI0033137686